LAGEKDRWHSLSESLKSDYGKVVGDIILSAGVIGYLGAFT